MVVKRASCFGPDFCFVHKYPESIFRSNTVLTYDQANMAEGFRYNRPDKKTTSLNRGSQLFLDHSDIGQFTWNIHRAALWTAVPLSHHSAPLFSTIYHAKMHNTAPDDLRIENHLHTGFRFVLYLCNLITCEVSGGFLIVNKHIDAIRLQWQEHRFNTLFRGKVYPS